MTWYAASLIIGIKLQSGFQDNFPVYENVVLIEADNPSDAREKAEKIGRAEENLEDSLERGGKPAEYYFAGVRKLISISNPFPMDLDQERPVCGTEITYSEFVLKNMEEVNKLAKGDEVVLNYIM